MSESKAFRAKRAADNVLKLAREWSVEHNAWLSYHGEQGEDERLFAVARALRARLEAACHELVALEAES